MKIRVPLIACICAVIISCDYGDKSITVYKIKKEKPTSTTKSPLEPTWVVPSGWVSQTPSSMHLAAFTAPYQGGDANITVMSLPGEGGGMLMNVNRWLRQLNLEPTEEENLKELGRPEDSKLGPFHVFELKNDAMPEQAFSVAVFNMKSRTLFVKLIAPIHAMKELNPSFLAFCKSFHMNGQ